MNTFRGRGGGVGVVARVPRGTRKRGERRGAGLERPVHVGIIAGGVRRRPGPRSVEMGVHASKRSFSASVVCSSRRFVTGDREEREASGARLQLRGLEDCRVVESCGPGILKLGPQHSQWNNHHKATEAREPNSRIFSFTSARERNSRIFSFTSRSVAEHRLRQGGRRGAGERAVRREGRPRESPSG
ncbi:uncharacterized protein [Excalfactoria chinensis]|uniref:uncharacterized protein isoform X2 n=1 Tax=Excalfactoria chinensis TaxID=46218 RepID=UPI003B3BC256